MCPRLSANYVSCCPPNMAQVSVWAGNLQSALSFLQTATFRGQQGRISRPVRAILSGQF